MTQEPLEKDSPGRKSEENFLMCQRLLGCVLKGSSVREHPALQVDNREGEAFSMPLNI